MRHGFVDIQNNGWMGASFTDEKLTADKVKAITRELVARGTLAYCPTVVTSSEQVFRRCLPAIVEAMRDPEVGPHILGIHMEGPFISPEMGARGAHPPEWIVEPSCEAFDRFQEWADGKIRILTLAPERPGAEELIRHATAAGVVVSMGHHLATDDQMEKAVQAGARLCTHLGNGLPNQIHRHQNPLWWELADDRVSGIFITDGHHLPADLIKVALRAKGVDRFIVVSDASPLAGLPPGKYEAFGGLPVVIDDTGLIYSEESKSLVGSHSTMLECMNHIAGLGVLSRKELWQVGVENPLKALGMAPTDIDGIPGPSVVFKDGRFVAK